MAKSLPVPTSPPAPEPPKHDIILKDEPNPSGARTVYSMVTPWMQEAIDQHTFEHPELFHQNEKSLMDAIKGKMGTKPHGIGETENRLRVAFWMEFDRAVELNEPMQLQRVYGGVCTREYFYQSYLRKPEKVAWMLCPPVAYTLAMEEALLFSITRMREILDFPLYNKKGEPDYRVGELILKAFEKLDLRIKGAVLQRIQSVNVHAHHHVPQRPIEDMSRLDERLAELEVKALEQGLPTIPVKADGEE